MELEIFTACHSATITNEEFSIHRIFEELEVEFVPIRPKSLFVVVRLRFHRSEYGRHNFDFSLLSPTGQRITPHWGGSLGVHSTAELEYACHTREFFMSHATFTELGTHKFVLVVDDRTFELPFIVCKMSEKTISDIVASN